MYQILLFTENLDQTLKFFEGVVETKEILADEALIFIHTTVLFTLVRRRG